MNDVATTTQRKFAGDFIRQKLNFTGKNSKIAFCATLWGLSGNVHGSSMACWNARDRLLGRFPIFLKMAAVRHHGF